MAKKVLVMVGGALCFCSTGRGFMLQPVAVPHSCASSRDRPRGGGAVRTQSPLCSPPSPRAPPSSLVLSAKRKSLVNELTDDMEPVSGKEGGEAEGEEEEEEGEGEAPQIFGTDRLLAEAKTPWRSIRIFVFSAFGLSSLVGGLTAATQLAASIAKQPDALPLQQCLINVAVDVGVFATSVFAVNFEVQAKKMVEETTARARETKKKVEATKVTSDVNQMRVAELEKCFVQLNLDKETKKVVALGELMKGAKQDVVLVVGTPTYVDDCILQAMTGDDNPFVNRNLIAVPVTMDFTSTSAAASDKGFALPGLPGGRPKYFQGYVAEPDDINPFRQIMEGEFQDAERQGVTNAREEGLIISLSRKGKILRRGLGQPKWDVIKGDFSV